MILNLLAQWGGSSPIKKARQSAFVMLRVSGKIVSSFWKPEKSPLTSSNFGQVYQAIMAVTVTVTPSQARIESDRDGPGSATEKAWVETELRSYIDVNYKDTWPISYMNICR